MYAEQRLMTEDLLFNYYMISSIREDEIYSPFPFYLDRKTFNSMVNATEVLDGVVKKIIDRMIANPNDRLFEMGIFPVLQEVINLKNPLQPFFWARYDAFQREDGGIFFSEFNYDKPCAQREIVISDMLNPLNNPNDAFNQKFIEGFEILWKDYGNRKEKPTIGILVDPTHYEELHLAYLYIDLLKSLGFDFIIAGGKNFKVEEDKVYAFDTQVDVIIRQYPTEHLHEVIDFKSILRLYEEGKILLINDPRSVLGQVKSLFMYLWQLVESEDTLLTQEEIKVIKETIPYTTIFHSDLVNELTLNKDKYVIKAIYGRYSEEVYIGKMHDAKGWADTIQYVLESSKTHIVQEFCSIKKEIVPKFGKKAFKDYEGFCNFGVYLTNGVFSGICARWSLDYLTSDDTVWFTPVGIREDSLELVDLCKENREEIWQKIADETSFKSGYVGAYTGVLESFSLQSLVLDEKRFTEIKYATEVMVNIFKKTVRHIQNNIESYGPKLGISKTLYNIVTQNFTDVMTLVGRMDWVIDTKGNLKLLEFNSETPAGMMEAIELNNIIKDTLKINMKDPNVNFCSKISECFVKIISDYQKIGEVKNIGIVASVLEEDWYNTNLIYEKIKHLPYKFIVGEGTGLEAKEGKLWLYGTSMDVIFRYYPLYWFDNDPYYEGVIKAMDKGTLSINPPSTYISQNKGFFSVIWDLMVQEFYDDEEKMNIDLYIPKTTLNPGELGTNDYCTKPFYGWEGQEISFSYTVPSLSKEREDLVYQERVDIQSISINTHTTMDSSKELAYPVLGAYVVGNEFAGLYSRVGGKITDKWAVFVPTYIR